MIEKDFSDYRDTIVNQCALSNTDGEMAFDMRGTQSSRILTSENGESKHNFVKTAKLDSCINEPVSFIKMDIEGEEYNALTGARGLITKHRPKLAISVYHNDDDLTKIPLLIHEMVPEYRFYLRHHTPFHVDTVLYAKL